MSDTKVVDTKYGKLKGKLAKNIVDGEFWSFKGIPYAKAPIGELRFKDPEAVNPWSSVREAFEFGSSCGQKNFMTNAIEGSDDCLYLNVYSRKIDSDSKRPTMVWIHGGGFVAGSGDDDLYGPDYFMRKDVVLVSINYRLGVLGFLNLDDEIAPGNQGLKDQVMALQWVRDNISNFGGDPDNVTIFGQSAGGASVHYLAISPVAKGLFHKLIIQSGVATNPWAIALPDSIQFAYKLCENLGKKAKSNQEIVDFLRTIEAKKLITEQEKLLTAEELLQFIFPFAPGIDSKSKNPFMPKDPQIMAENGFHLPVMIGYTSREGLCVFDEAFSEFNPQTADYKSFNDNFDKFLHPNIIQVMGSKFDISANDLKRFYYENEKVSSETLAGLANMFGDVHFVEGIHSVMRTQLEKSNCPIYAYQYTYDKGVTISKSRSTLKIGGAAHGDELSNLFRTRFLEKMSVPPLSKGTTSYSLMEQMVELWVNFATCGIPTPERTSLTPYYWQPLNDSKILRHLRIGSDVRMDVAIFLNEQYNVYARNQK